MVLCTFSSFCLRLNLHFLRSGCMQQSGPVGDLLSDSPFGDNKTGDWITCLVVGAHNPSDG